MLSHFHILHIYHSNSYLIEHQAFRELGIPGSYGTAIIAFTVFVKVKEDMWNNDICYSVV